MNQVNGDIYITRSVMVYTREEGVGLSGTAAEGVGRIESQRVVILTTNCYTFYKSILISENDSLHIW